jgi:arsenate reductase
MTPLRVLVLCTGNSARSQMAEALFGSLGAGVVYAESAGSRPAARVNPIAIEALAHSGIAWPANPPRGIDAVEGKPWDVVLTVCDNAKEACPIFPGATITAHWGMPDPAEVVGTEGAKREAFDDALRLLRRRIEMMLALPLARLDRSALQTRLREIGSTGRER